MSESNEQEPLELIDPVTPPTAVLPHIIITSAIFEKTNLSKYVAYEIKIISSESKFELRKRYTDFKKLRNIFLHMWGGTYIPPLPRKKVIGKFDPQFIEGRRKILEKFLQQCVTIPHLCNSSSFQSFLKGIDVAEEKPSITEIQQSFESCFPNYMNTPVKLDYPTHLSNAKKNFEVALTELQVFKKFADKCCDQLYKHQKSVNSFMGSFETLAGVYLCKKVEVKTRDLLFNPYWALRDWVDSEILDTEAILEAISYLEGYEDQLNKLVARSEDEDEKLRKALEGKKGLKNIFKDREDVIKSRTEALERSKREIIATEVVRNILFNLMIDVEIYKFVSIKSSVFHNCLKDFISQNTEEYENELGLIKSLESNFNI